jgi:hypothetical protein
MAYLVPRHILISRGSNAPLQVDICYASVLDMCDLDLHQSFSLEILHTTQRQVLSAGLLLSRKMIASCI